MKILHTADIHLREYEDERWAALENIIRTGKKEKVNLCLISGDLFNQGVDAEKLRPKIRKLFSGNGFKILIIPGNHDKDCFRPGLFFGEDTVILNESTHLFENESVRIAGLPFEPLEGQRLLDKLAGLKKGFTRDKINILICHGELLDSFFSRRDFGDEGGGRYMPFWLWYFHDLNADYVLAGHFHSRFDVRKLEKQGYFVYPGSPVSITRKETGRRKVNLFEPGREPGEYEMDSFHFESKDLFLDPFTDTHPLSLIREKMKGLHPEARVLMTISGFVDGKKLGMNETVLRDKIKDAAGPQLEELSFEATDVQTIISNSLFQDFKAKVEAGEFEDEMKASLLEYTLRAMIEAES